MAQQVVFNAKELSDVYALKVLYDHLVSESFEHNLFFTGSVDDNRSREVLDSAPILGDDSSIDVVVNTISDIGNRQFGNMRVGIDTALLKNCAKPLSKSEKRELRTKYNIDSSKPVMVIGYANGSSEELELIKNFHKDASIYLVGSVSKLNLPEEMLESVHFVTQHGILKDYYAIADLSLNAHNLHRNHFPLHNFIEATEGGPLFMVPSINTKQYGYKELVKLGVIQECQDITDIVDKVRVYLSDFKGNLKHVRNRNKHIQNSRTKYLPLMKNVVLQTLGEAVNVPSFDEVNVSNLRSLVSVMHADSNWGRHISDDTTEDKFIFKPSRKENFLKPILLDSYFSSRHSFSKYIKTHLGEEALKGIKTTYLEKTSPANNYMPIISSLKHQFINDEEINLQGLNPYGIIPKINQINYESTGQKKLINEDISELSHFSIHGEKIPYIYSSKIGLSKTFEDLKKSGNNEERTSHLDRYLGLITPSMIEKAQEMYKALKN